jgi:hypothetical protein
VDFNYEAHTGHDWDILFDLYNEFETAGAPNELLTAIETLISKKAHTETLKLKNIVEEMSHDILKTKSKKSQSLILGKLKRKISTLMKSSSDSSSQIMLSKLMGKIVSLRSSEKLVSRKDLDDLYFSIGKFQASESEFILKSLEKIENVESDLTLETFEKIFRSGNYDIHKPAMAKIKYLRTVFEALKIDKWRRLNGKQDPSKKKKAS